MFLSVVHESLMNDVDNCKIIVFGNKNVGDVAQYIV